MENKCLVCKKKFKTYPSKVKYGRGKYCSRKCSDQVTLIKKGQRLSPETEIKKGEKLRLGKGVLGSNRKFTQSRKDGRKYILIYKPDHPLACKNGYVRENRLVVEDMLGRCLLPDEVVHHKDGDTLNNNPENLSLMFKKDHDRMNVSMNIHRRWH